MAFPIYNTGALEYLCAIRGIHHKEVAEAIGVSPSTVQDWIKGRRVIPSKRREQLASFFEVEEKYFEVSRLYPYEKADLLDIEINRVMRHDSWERYIPEGWG